METDGTTLVDSAGVEVSAWSYVTTEGKSYPTISRSCFYQMKSVAHGKRAGAGYRTEDSARLAIVTALLSIR